ncbi:Hypothetical protein PHPALM_37013 [Phytophthora palmivora]|uniref:ATP-dependent DNA helicase n=1 Tax=Phytophthora palmivora TaxID=4796 RepID=A0A2P4WYG7_9STRA|nr:Hypothetical protein PHPALM_37013 [Phytophthora palmivora]
MTTHCIGHHQSEAVPVITGVRMPYMNSETPPELVAKRAQCALVLFKPFRCVQDLVSDPASEEAWRNAYFQWEPTQSSFVREIMANMDDYYQASIQAEHDEVTGDKEDNDNADSDEVLGTRNNIDDAVANVPCENEVSSGHGRIDDICLAFADEDNYTMADEDANLPIFSTTKSTSLLSNILHQELLGTTAESTVRTANNIRNNEHPLEMSLGDLQDWVKDSATDETELSTSGCPRNEHPVDVIVIIQCALESTHEWSPPTEQQDCPPLALHPYPSINDVSTAFTLNRRQHVAFSLIATALLRRFQQQERANTDESADYRSSDFESRLRDDQLNMFLGGAGSTEKSRVIDAVDAFCSGWHRSNATVKAALTGKAATLIGGRTLASFLVQLEHAIKEKKFSPLDLLIIDEILMMSKAE